MINNVKDRVDYESFLALTDSMLERIGQEDWEGMVRVAQARESALNILKKQDWNGDSQDFNHEQKAHFLKKILSLNQQIEERVQSRMDKLQKQLRDEKNLLGSYGFYSEG